MLFVFEQLYKNTEAQIFSCSLSNSIRKSCEPELFEQTERPIFGPVKNVCLQRAKQNGKLK